MSLERILLGLLRDPASGYDLRKEFDRGPRHFWTAELSQIYPALDAMERRGWLTSRRTPSARGPARRVYRRTRIGTRVLHQWLRAAPDLETERLAYIGQLAFLAELKDLAQTARFVDQLHSRFRRMASELRAADASLRRIESRAGLDPDEFHERLCVQVGIEALRGKIAACRKAGALIRARASRASGLSRASRANAQRGRRRA